MTHRKRYIALAGCVAALLLGCADKSTAPPPPALVKMGFTLSDAGLASLVDSVTLTIVYSDSSRVTQVLTLVAGEIRETVPVRPDGEVTFILRAYRSSGLLLYEGRTTAAVPVGQQVEVSILLEPAPGLSMLRLGPLFREFSLGSSDSIEVFVDLHQVTSLYGASFRLNYDPETLEFRRAYTGSFLSSDGADLLASAFPAGDGPGQLGYAVTRIHPFGETKTGISGSGRLARFIFRAKAAGQTGITMITSAGYQPRLTGPDGDPIPQSANIVLESATVRVTAP